MEEQKEKNWGFDDTDIEKQFIEAIERGKKRIKEGKRTKLPDCFLVKPEDKVKQDTKE